LAKEKNPSTLNLDTVVISSLDASPNTKSEDNDTGGWTNQKIIRISYHDLTD